MSGSPPSVRTRPSTSSTSKNRGTTSIATPAASQRRSSGRISESLRRVNETTTRSMRCSTRTRSRSSIRPITGGASSPNGAGSSSRHPTTCAGPCTPLRARPTYAAGHDPGAQHQHALALVPGASSSGLRVPLTSVVASARPSSRLDVRLELRRQEEPSARRSGPGADPPRFARIAKLAVGTVSPRGDPPGRQSHLNWLAWRAVRVDPGHRREHAGHPGCHGVKRSLSAAPDDVRRVSESRRSARRRRAPGPRRWRRPRAARPPRAAPGVADPGGAGAYRRARGAAARVGAARISPGISARVPARWRSLSMLDRRETSPSSSGAGGGAPGPATCAGPVLLLG